jgi:hypothetical protein
MNELPARAATTLGANLNLAATMPSDPVASTTDADTSKLLDIEMHKLTRTTAFIAIWWLWRLQA